jgi:ATP phosphoribosyltransferase
MEQPLTIALPKGRVMNDAIMMLMNAGVPIGAIEEDSRKLIFFSQDKQFRFIAAKPFDIPTYVEYGVADLGVVGKDILLEEEKDVYELLDLKIGFCRMVVAGREEVGSYPIYYKVATKFPHIAEEYFTQKGEQVEIIKLNGSIEIAPIIGLAEKIVDIVSTGKTLKENRLIELEQICTITARLIANRVSFRLRNNQVLDLLQRMKEGIPDD